MRIVSIRFLAFVLFFVALTSNVAHPQSAAALSLDGDITQSTSWTLDDLKKLPRTTQKVTNASGSQDIYEGVDLAVLLVIGGVPLKSDLKGKDVAKYLHAEGQDGFVAAFSLPEFDSGSFLIADTLNGSPLPSGVGPLQIISPGEVRHSRWIKDLILLRIETSVK
jgi:DMSO/TMAO reductase YedYZ molybdopterin-dependent catalytic subunit